MTTQTRCTLCRRPGARLDAGGDVRLVHEACFDAWDRREEAEALGLVALLADLPLPAEPAPVATARRVPPRARAVAAAVEACRG